MFPDAKQGTLFTSILRYRRRENVIFFPQYTIGERLWLYVMPVVSILPYICPLQSHFLKLALAILDNLALITVKNSDYEK